MYTDTVVICSLILLGGVAQLNYLCYMYSTSWGPRVGGGGGTVGYQLTGISISYNTCRLWFGTLLSVSYSVVNERCF